MSKRKGIILSGGSGTRLYPATESLSKQLIPIYDKPMIYYPLSVLMLADIQDILVISTPRDLPIFKQLLKDGKQFGLNISYIVQKEPEGLAQAFHLGKEFLDGAPCTLILGDNLFFGHKLPTLLTQADQESSSTIFAYHVNEPERYGVVEFNKNKEVLSIVEKPKIAPSSYAVTGLYFYDQNVCDYAASIQKSPRGEYEITDLNNIYLKNKSLKVTLLGRGHAWLDTGTHDSLLEASSFVQTLEKRQGIKVSCPEEIAFRKKWITQDSLLQSAERYRKNSYGQYLKKLAEGKIDVY